MKYILSLLLVALNIINIPLSNLYMRVQKWYLPMRKKDPITFYAFAPFYWALVALATIIGYPCEEIAKHVH